MERELLLLGLLRREDMHGYQLHEFINQNMASCVDLKKSTAYYLLDKMAVAGWISVTEEQEGNRPPRRVYQLTAAGETHFQQLLRENLAGYSPSHFSGDIGLAFLDVLEPTEARQLLLQRQADMTHLLAEAQNIPLHKGSMQYVIEHQARHLAAELAWLNEIIARIDSIHEKGLDNS